MIRDSVDSLLHQWGEECPDLNADGLAVCVRIQRLARALDLAAEQALASLDLALWEYDVLSALRRQGEPYCLPTSELARTTRLSGGAMTHRVTRLESRGLVVRRADENDRRAVLVALTAAGLALTDAATRARMAAADTALAPLRQPQRRELARLLRTLLVACDDDEVGEVDAGSR